MEQEESSHPPCTDRERAVKRNPTQDGFTGRIQEEECGPLHRDPRSEREERGRDPQRGNPSRRLGEPSLLDVGLVRPTTLKVGNSLEKGSCPTYVTPFSREILEAPRLGKVKMPSVDLFDETTDPDDHLDVYKAHMYVQDVDDATCCRYFPATLKGIAQRWFNGLPSGSVTSFFQLAELFSSHFVASKKEKKTSIYLARIRQQRGEDLKGYVRRFNHEAVLIPDLQDGVAYAAFLNGLLPGRFKFTLAESKVTTLVEALGRAKSFIQATEICAGEELPGRRARRE